MTPNDRPSEAMMNENSPICAIENPQRMADFRLSPPSMNENDPSTACPMSIVSTSVTMGAAYCTSICGSTSMPTDTKKMAPNRFFTGSTRRSIFSASTVSASMLPMMKAPKADEKPTLVENTAMAQHMPSVTMSSTSSFTSSRMRRSSSGTAKMPTTSHNTRKKAIFTTEPIIWLPSGLLPLAMADSITIITMASMSSSISTDITRPVNCCWRSPRSSKAL